MIFSACVCYNVCRGDGDLRMGGIRASVSYASPPYAGASCVFCFYRHGAPALANLVVPLFLSPRPTNRVGGAIFFAYSSITQSLPACLVGGCHPHLPVRMPCGFLEVSYGTVCLPVPLCLSVSSLLGTPLVMSSFQSSRSSSRPTYPHRPSPRPPTRRAGRLALSCGAFHVRTPWYNSPSFLIQSLIASPACLLPHAHQSLGSSPSVGF